MLIIAIVGCSIVGLGEWMLHYVPGNIQRGLEFLDVIPLDRAAEGHLMAISGVPIYFAGYYAIMRIFSSTSYWASRLVLVIGIYAFALSGIWFGSRYFMAEILQKVSSADAQHFQNIYLEFYQPVLWVLQISMVMVSLLYVYLVLNNRMGLPKWVAIVNPVVLYGLVWSTTFLIKPLGEHLFPMAISVAHFIFFTVLLYHYKRKVIPKL